MAAYLPRHITSKLAGHTFESFEQYSMAFWMAIAEDPVYSQQFISAQLHRIKQG
jgi:hypothetical protein